MAYSFPDELAISPVEDGTTLLVSGPPLSGKYYLLTRLLAHGRNPVVVVSTEDGVDRVLGDIELVSEEPREERVGVVDCVTRQQSAEPPNETPLHKYPSSPRNLTSIGVKFTELSGEFEAGTPARVGVHTLSQLLIHTDKEPLYQFLQVFCGQITNAGWLGLGTIHSTIHDEQPLHTIQSCFDALLETRLDENDRRQFRVRGIEAGPSEWRSF